MKRALRPTGLSKLEDRSKAKRRHRRVHFDGGYFSFALGMLLRVRVGPWGFEPNPFVSSARRSLCDTCRPFDRVPLLDLRVSGSWCLMAIAGSVMRLVACSATATVAFVACVTSIAARNADLNQQADLDGLLQKAGAYLDGYQHTLATVIAEETYNMTGPAGIHGANARLTSDILLVGMSGSWVEFRDVFEVEGRPVRDHTARLEALLGGPDVLGKAQRIADESARYNGSLIPRNINVPTMALTYLMRSNQTRSSFRLAGNGDEKTFVIGFQETARPPLIHSDRGTTETSGRFWIDPSSGAVRKTELVVRVPQGANVEKDPAVAGAVTVTYAEDGSLKFLVPHEMEESYDLPAGVRGRAVYSHYKSFNVVVTTGRGGH